MGKYLKTKPKKVGDHPVQDQRAGLPTQRVGGRFVTAYDPEVAERIVERIAEGELLKDICAEPGMPHRVTFHRWVVRTPELARAYNAAVSLSAHSLEEDALSLAREIKTRSAAATGTEVRAYEVAMAQFRWSAERRDPAKYANRQAVNVQVPIQINTTLDLGAKALPSDIYTVTASVPTEVEPEALENRPVVSNEIRHVDAEGRPVTARGKRIVAPREGQ